MDILQTIRQEFNLSETHTTNIVSLIDEGNTIPFIARYRKEMTGACDDQVLRSLFDRLTYLRNLEKRNGVIIYIPRERHLAARRHSLQHNCVEPCTRRVQCGCIPRGASAYYYHIVYMFHA